MSKLTAAQRTKLPAKDFGGPGPILSDGRCQSRPRCDPGAVRAWHAGHITDEEAQHIIAEARAKLGDAKS